MESERWYAIGYGNEVLMPQTDRDKLPENGDGYSYILACEGGKVVEVFGPIENYAVTTILHELNQALLLEHKENSDAEIYEDSVTWMIRSGQREYSAWIQDYKRKAEQGRYEAGKFRERHDGWLTTYPKVEAPVYIGLPAEDSYFPGLAGL